MLSFAPSPATAVALLGEIGNAEAGGLPRFSEDGCEDDDGRAQGQVVLLQILACHHGCVWASAPASLETAGALGSSRFPNPRQPVGGASNSQPSQAGGALEREGHGSSTVLAAGQGAWHVLSLSVASPRRVLVPLASLSAGLLHTWVLVNRWTLRTDLPPAAFLGSEMG